MSVGSIAAKGRRAGKSPWVERLGRTGLVAKGLLYGVVALLAAKVALGGREQSPDRQGALREIAQQPFGKGLLVLLAIGLAAYASWRLAQAILDRDDEGEGAKGLAKRAGSFGRAAWYGTLCALTVAKIAGAGETGGNEKKTTGGVLAMPLGRYIVLAVGLAFVAAALFNLYRAVTCKFEKKLKKGEMNKVEEAGATTFGILGHLARGVVFGLVGWFLVKAAWQFDPKEAVGLDGALLEVSQQPYGGLLLGSVAAGLMAYGIWCLVQARYRKI